jgi:molybdopterin-guanine dinucleotide biosynthesis protein B
MNIFAIVGHSESGKTRLISQLIPELKQRGYTVAVIKHCPHGFELDTEGKDSWKFIEAGSDAVSILSTDRVAILKKYKSKLNPKSIIGQYFSTIDVILVEGYKENKAIKKIEVLQKGISEELECSPEELIAIVSDFEVNIDKPVFHPDQTGKIVEYLEDFMERRTSSVSLHIDGDSVPMNAFVQKIFKNTILGMVNSLEDIQENPELINLTLTRKEKNNEKA